MSRILMLWVVVASGLAITSVASVSAAANPNLIWVVYDSSLSRNVVSHSSIAASVGDTFTLENRRNQDNGISYVSIVNGTGSVTMNSVSCTTDTSCRVFDKTSGAWNQGVFTIVSAGTVTVRRYLNNSGTTTVGTLTISVATGDDDETPGPAVPYHRGSFDPNGGTCAFDETNVAATLGSVVVDDAPAVFASTPLDLASTTPPITVGDRVVAAEHGDPFMAKSMPPARLRVLDLDDLSPVSTATLAADENVVEAMASDGVHLYVAVAAFVPPANNSVPGGRRGARLVKIRVADMARVASVDLGSDATQVGALVLAHGFAFVAIDSADRPRVEKVRLDSLTRVARIDLSSIDLPVVGVTVVGSSLFVVSSQGTFAPAVWRYSTGTLAFTGGAFLGVGSPASVAYDGTRLLVGLRNTESGVATVDPRTLSVDRSRVSGTSQAILWSDVFASGTGEVTSNVVELGPGWSLTSTLDFGTAGVGSLQRLDGSAVLPFDAGRRVGPYVVHTARRAASVDKVRSLVDDVTVSSSPWTYGMVGYGYAPAAVDCWRDGHAFAGWSADDGMTVLPVLAHEGRQRAFVAASAEYVAQWTPTAALHLHLVPGSTATVTHGSSSTACTSSCRVDVAIGSSVVVAATTASDVTFAGFAGDSTSRASSIELVVEDDAELVVTTTIDEIDISLATTGDGVGSITWSGAATGCSGRCTERFATGSSITFTAVPRPGSIFTGWGGDCAGTAIGAPCTLTVRSGVSVSAGFEAGRRVVVPVAPTVGFVASDVQPGILCGGVFAVCDASFPAGTAVRLFGLSSEWTTPRSWTGPCTVTAGSCAIDFSSSSTATVSAVFDDWYQVADFSRYGNVVSVESNGSGSVVAVMALGPAWGTKVTLLEWDSVTATYVERGSPIVETSSPFGRPMSLSSDGSVVAIGDPLAGSVTLLRWDASTRTWSQFGAPLDRYQGQMFGRSVSLSGDGRTLAVGSPAYSGNNRNGLGRVYVFRYSATADVWLLDASLQGGVANEYLGYQVGLSQSGDRLFVARPDILGSRQPRAMLAFTRTGQGWVGAPGITGSSPGFASSVDVNAAGTVAIVADDTQQTFQAYVSINSSWVPWGTALAAPVPPVLSGSGLVVATGGDVATPARVWSATLFGWASRGSSIPDQSLTGDVDLNADGTVIVTSEGVYRFGVRPS